MKRLSECTDRSESFRFVKDLRRAVRRDQKNRNMRLQSPQIRNHLKPGDVRQIQIYDTKPEALRARLINTVNSIRNQDNFITSRFKYHPERVAYRRFVINYED